MNSTNLRDYIDIMLSSHTAEKTPVVLQSDIKEKLINYLRKKELIGVCMILEDVKLKTKELSAIREMRNAIVHNKSDLSKNRNLKSLAIVKDYLKKLINNDVIDSGVEPLEVYFSLDGSIVVLDKINIYACLRQILMKYRP